MSSKSDRTQPVELTNLTMVTDNQGRILVQDRLDPNWGGLCFPGGHVEKGESFVRSAIREVFEETGLTVEDPVLCGVKQFPMGDARYIVFLFKADKFSGTLRSSPEGPVFWVRRDELANYRLSNNFQDLIELMEDPGRSEFCWYGSGDDCYFEIL